MASKDCQLCEENKAEKEVVAEVPGNKHNPSVLVCMDCIENRGLEMEELFHEEVNQDALGYSMNYI